MEKLEIVAKTLPNEGEFRCKGWCHKSVEPDYLIKLPSTEYFSYK